MQDYKVISGKYYGGFEKRRGRWSLTMKRREKQCRINLYINVQAVQAQILLDPIKGEY